MEFHQRIIDERREILKNNNNNNNNDKESSTDAGYSIFIDHILNNPGRFNDQEIRDHVITVLSAGKFLITSIHGLKTILNKNLFASYVIAKFSCYFFWLAD